MEAMSEPSAVALVVYDLFDLMDDDEDDIAFHQFFGDDASHNAVDHFEMILFEEWLLFDWRDIDNNSLLKRGISESSFTKVQRERCQQLLANNIYSDWQIVDRVIGYGITLEDVYSGEQYKVRHARYSTELALDSVFCARLALLNDRWIPASGFIEPHVLQFPQGNRADFYDKRPKEFNPRTFMLERRARAEKLLSGHPDAIPNVPLPVAHQTMKQALKDAGLDSFVNLEAIETWINKDLNRTTKQVAEAPYPLAMSLLLGLAVGCKESIVQELTLAIASMQRAATVLRSQPKPKSGDEGMIVSTFDPNEWLDLFDEAAGLMRAGKEVEAAKYFEQAFEIMHKNRGVNPLVFRQLHNAAVAYLYSGEEVLARKALAASLELNPVYDLGLKTQKALDEGKMDQLLALSKLFRNVQSMIGKRKKGQRARRASERQTSPVIKYYDWVKDLGINFYDNNPTEDFHYVGDSENVQKPKPKPVLKSPKTGRNDPCPCGKQDKASNPIKYKKCHGAAT